MMMKVGHLATCVPSASQTIRFPHILACYIGNSQLCQTCAENANMVFQISIPEKPSEVPKSKTRCLAPASRIEARAVDVRGVHRGAFAQQQLRSRDVAVGRHKVQRRSASGALPVGPLWASGGTRAQRPRRRGRTTEVVGMLSSRPGQPTKER